MGQSNGKMINIGRDYVLSWCSVCPLWSSGHPSCCSLNWLTWPLFSERPEPFDFFFSSAENMLSPRCLSNFFITFLTFIKPPEAPNISLITFSCTSLPLQLRKLIEFCLARLPPSAQCRKHFKEIQSAIKADLNTATELNRADKTEVEIYVLICLFGFSWEQRTCINYFTSWNLQGNQNCCFSWIIMWATTIFSLSLRS